jgi:hypothetical protein
MQAALTGDLNFAACGVISICGGLCLGEGPRRELMRGIRSNNSIVTPIRQIFRNVRHRIEANAS